ncbi:MAG: hypothetical protein KKC46_13620 [Proteobacteria bacterium]|nr:hypothetical protein [Pseudomonadota bacterium]
MQLSTEDIQELVKKRVQEENKIIAQQNKAKIIKLYNNRKRTSLNKKEQEIDSKCLLDILLKDRIGKNIIYPVFQRSRRIYNDMERYTEVTYEDEHFEKIKDVTNKAFYSNWCPFVGDLTPLADGISKLNYEYNLFDAYRLLLKIRYSLFKITSADLARQLKLFYRPHLFGISNENDNSAYIIRTKNDCVNYMSYDCFPSSKYIEDISGLSKKLLDIYRKLYVQFNFFINRGRGKKFIISVANDFFELPDFDFNASIQTLKDCYTKNHADLLPDDKMIFALSIEWINKDMTKIKRKITFEEITLILSLVFIVYVLRGVFLSKEAYDVKRNELYLMTKKYVKGFVKIQDYFDKFDYIKKKPIEVLKDKEQESKNRSNAKKIDHEKKRFAVVAADAELLRIGEKIISDRKALKKHLTDLSKKNNDNSALSISKEDTIILNRKKGWRNALAGEILSYIRSKKTLSEEYKNLMKNHNENLPKKSAKIDPYKILDKPQKLLKLISNNFQKI